MRVCEHVCEHVLLPTYTDRERARNRLTGKNRDTNIFIEKYREKEKDMHRHRHTHAQKENESD